MNNIKHICETCVHEDGMGRDYCGPYSTDTGDRWQIKPELVEELLREKMSRLEEENTELRRAINKLKENER